MSSIVNGYMDAIERENDMFNRSIEIESNKISLMVEAYYNKLENDYLLAEQKVMMENGTYDDLTYLYTEANEEADKNKETIFQKIKAFFQRIFDSIKNLFRRGDAYEGDAPKCFMDAANGSGSNEIVNFFKKVGNDFKNGNVIDAIETLGKGGLTAFSVCVAIDKGVESASNIIHYPKKAYLKVKDWFNRLTSELERIESELIDAAQASKNEKATSFANAVKAKLGKLILTVKGWWQKFVSFITDVKDKITGKNNEEGKDKEKKDEKGQSGEQGESNEQPGDSGSNSGTRKMKVKGKLTGNNKRNRNSKPASGDSGSNSKSSTNSDGSYNNNMGSRRRVNPDEVAPKSSTNSDGSYNNNMGSVLKNKIKREIASYVSEPYDNNMDSKTEKDIMDRVHAKIKDFTSEPYDNNMDSKTKSEVDKIIKQSVKDYVSEPYDNNMDESVYDYNYDNDLDYNFTESINELIDIFDQF